jgi:hypothetical protein
MTDAPHDLGDAGAALWAAVQGTYTLTEYEAVLLASACRHADLIARLELLLADGLVSVGSAGQPRLSAAVGELRQSRLALSRLLTDLALPVDDTGADGRPRAVVLPSVASRRASHAAQVRHDRARRRQVRSTEGA